MDYKQMKVIDFSQGIKAKEVMHNDLALQQQIETERLSIAGYGINYGLDLELSDEFNLIVKDGTVVDKDGIESYVEGAMFSIDKPNLILRKQRVHSVNRGEITLSDIPYSERRTCPSEYESKDYWGIEAYYEDDPSTSLNISAISGTTIYTNATDENRYVIVNYNTAYDRIDTVYIDDEYKVRIKAGIDSTTASSYIPNDCKYVLGFIKVVSRYYDSELQNHKAKASIIKEFTNRRTVYTDINNDLYLCGIAFDSLLKIYFDEPSNPKEGMLWYDMATNKLKVWRRTDNFIFTDIIKYTSINPNDKQKFKTSVGYRKSQLSVYIEERNYQGDKVWTKLSDKQLEYYTDLEESDKDEQESREFRIIPKMVTGTNIRYAINRYDDSFYWVPINDTSYISANECKMWAANNDGTNLVEYLPGLNLEEMNEDRPNHDLTHFIFKAEELNLRFTPYKNELSLMIEQIPLHRDQFIELTVEDVLNSDELTQIAIDHYGWTNELLQDIKDNNLEVGIGFKLLNSLDRPGFIEVNIQHRVNDSILKNKLQRNASFAKSETIIYDMSTHLKDDIATFPTLIPYRYNEQQLDVYIDGKRLRDDLITENSTMSVRGSMCNSFSIDTTKVNLMRNAEVTYKITTNVYSYDHVQSAMEHAQTELVNKVAHLEDLVEKLNTKVNNLINNS